MKLVNPLSRRPRLLVRQRLLQLIAFASFSWPALVSPKEIGIRSPGGRDIYSGHETFDQALDHTRRDFVIEVALGQGPQGNLGVILGWLNQPLRGFEWYAGFGTEFNPALHFSLSGRYMFNVNDYRPYVSLGYFYKVNRPIATHSHNAFFELGYKWVLHDTLHLTAGIGVRRLLSIRVNENSIIASQRADPVLREEQLDSVTRWLPMAVLRFSRAF